MKVKVIEKAFYQKALVNEGQIIDYKGDTIPSWATLADGSEVIEKKDLPPIINTEVSEGINTNATNTNPVFETEENIKAELEKILDLAVENEIWLDIPADVPELEQIKLFKEAFEEKGIKLEINNN